MTEDHVKTSKFLSFVLRHKPEAIGLHLDGEGWASVDDLIACAASDGKELDRAVIESVVATNDKQRFELSDDGSRIRARQGHSLPVDLGLEPQVPPELLYHGTASRSLASIRGTGLVKGERHHVHLSQDVASARAVGQRYGRPVILRLQAGRMARDGFEFFLSTNGVWLVNRVPPEYIEFPEEDD